MSFTSYSTYEEYSNDDCQTISRSTVVVHELTDGEFASILTLGDDNDDAGALKVPQTQYEIESGASDMGESSEDDQDDDDDDGDSDEFVLDHWFPSLLHNSMIEFLDDGEDEFMLDHAFDILTSNESAEIEEDGEEEKNNDLTDHEKQKELDRHRATRPRTPKQRKRPKHKHHDQEEKEEDMSVPVEVIHIVL